MQQAQKERAAAWPAPTLQPLETPEAKRKRATAIQDEYDEWIVANAPRKRWRQPSAENSSLQNRLRDTLLPTDPMELEDTLLGGSRGFITNSLNPSNHFMGLNLNWRD